MKNLIAILSAITLLMSITHTAKSARGSDIEFQAGLGHGVKVDIHVDVVVNPNAPKNGKTILLLHGLAHTGKVWKPMTEEILRNPTTKSTVRNIVIPNLPGRGGSSLPTRMKFGILDIEDYADIEVQVLKECKRQDLEVDVIVAHSMGGLITQVAQDQLLSEGKSLRSLGVKRVTIIGSSVPSEVPDPFLEAGNGLGLLGAFSASSPELGQFVGVDVPTFVGLFFTDFSGNVVPGAPPTEIAVSRIMSVESYTAALQTVGTADLRPSVRAGAFSPANGTRLKVVVGNQDPFSDIYVQTALCRHLTLNMSPSAVEVVDAPGHDNIYSDPPTVISALEL